MFGSVVAQEQRGMRVNLTTETWKSEDGSQRAESKYRVAETLIY
jgi:hypothetical protein